MKSLYRMITEAEIKLKDGYVMTYPCSNKNWLERMFYGELPEIQITEYTTDFVDVLKCVGLPMWNKPSTSHKRGRVAKIHDEQFYIDDIELITLRSAPMLVVNPGMDKLYKHLKFNELTELIFDREQTLKSMLSNKEKMKDYE